MAVNKEDVEAAFLAAALARPARTAEVILATDPGDFDRLQELRAAAFMAKFYADKAAEDKDLPAKDRKAKEQEATEAEAAFRSRLAETGAIHWQLRSIGARVTEALAAAHPPTDEQVEKALDARELWRRANPDAPISRDTPAVPIRNPQTYPAALLAAATAHVTLGEHSLDSITVTTAQAIIDSDWSYTDIVELITTAESLDSSGSRVDELGKGLS